MRKKLAFLNKEGDVAFVVQALAAVSEIPDGGFYGGQGAEANPVGGEISVAIVADGEGDALFGVRPSVAMERLRIQFVNRSQIRGPLHRIVPSRKSGDAAGQYDGSLTRPRCALKGELDCPAFGWPRSSTRLSAGTWRHHDYPGPSVAHAAAGNVQPVRAASIGFEPSHPLGGRAHSQQPP